MNIVHEKIMQEHAAIEWQLGAGLVEYPAALAAMDARNRAIQDGSANELIWLLEHLPLYTAGTSADPDELLSQQFPVYPAGRGGRYTYHGPGQRTGYVLLNLGQRCRDVRHFVFALEQWLIDSLGQCDIAARRAEGRIGIWCDTPSGKEAKIAAIGLRIRKWVTMHGFAVNIDPDLTHFDGIVPCGIAEYPVTSFAALGSRRTMADFDAALRTCFPAFLDFLAKGAHIGSAE